MGFGTANKLNGPEVYANLRSFVCKVAGSTKGLKCCDNRLVRMSTFEVRKMPLT